MKVANEMFEMKIKNRDTDIWLQLTSMENLLNSTFGLNKIIFTLSNISFVSKRLSGPKTNNNFKKMYFFQEKNFFLKETNDIVTSGKKFEVLPTKILYFRSQLLVSGTDNLFLQWRHMRGDWSRNALVRIFNSFKIR